MAVYAIGDIQECYRSLRALLREVGFDRQRDRLWLVGDLVNRGPQSVEVLRFVADLGDRARVVLGNHDLHLLAVAAGVRKLRRKDTFGDVLDAQDGEALLTWLRQRPLLLEDRELGWMMVHAGLLPQWDLAQAASLAREAEARIQGPESAAALTQMYGDLPSHWSDSLGDPERLRVIINGLTRLRYCDASGQMSFSEVGPPNGQADGFLPWFRVPGRRSAGGRIVIGHWSALGLWQEAGVLALDSGCVWGRALTAAQLDRPGVPTTQVSCCDQGPRRASADIKQ